MSKVKVKVRAYTLPLDANGASADLSILGDISLREAFETLIEFMTLYIERNPDKTNHAPTIEPSQAVQP